MRNSSFLLRRLLSMIPTLILVSLAVFLLLYLMPGDPARIIAGDEATEQEVADLRAEMGLDKPIWVQYKDFLVSAVKGDLGTSYFLREPVGSLIAERLPATLELGLFALIVALVVGIPLGVAAGVRPYSFVDRLSSVLALIGVSWPNFWLGIMLMYVFSVKLQWFPLTGRGETWFSLDEVRHLVLPGIVLAMGPLASTTRLVRAGMLETLGLDFIRTARAKGLAERIVHYRHALRPALIPVITNLGLQMGVLLGGAVLTETVFAWPGVGRLLTDAIGRRDIPVTQGIVLILSAFFVLVNTLVDIAYSYIDPRIRYS